MCVLGRHVAHEWQSALPYKGGNNATPIPKSAKQSCVMAIYRCHSCHQRSVPRKIQRIKRASLVFALGPCNNIVLSGPVNLKASLANRKRLESVGMKGGREHQGTVLLLHHAAANDVMGDGLDNRERCHAAEETTKPSSPGFWPCLFLLGHSNLLSGLSLRPVALGGSRLAS